MAVLVQFGADVFQHGRGIADALTGFGHILVPLERKSDRKRVDFSLDSGGAQNGIKLGAVVGTQVLPVLHEIGLAYVLGACLVTCVAGALLTQVCVEAKAYETVLLEADAGEGGVA